MVGLTSVKFPQFTFHLSRFTFHISRFTSIPFPNRPAFAIT
jgi:hypothetical protein